MKAVVMNPDVKQMLGPILGQIFRLQEMVRPGSSGTDELTRYKLILGFEDEIDIYLGRTAIHVSMESCSKVANILSEIWNDPQEREKVDAFMVKDRLRWAGIEEADIYVILTAFRLEHRFVDLFKRIDPDGTQFCRTDFAI